MIHSGEERAISCCQPHRILAHPKDFEGKPLGGDKRRRYSVRAPDKFTAGRLLTYTESAAEKNKQTLEEEEGDLEDGALDRGARRQG